MGQKVNPVGMRVGINKNWNSRWFADKDYAKLLNEDSKIRALIEKKVDRSALLSHIEIERKRTEEKGYFTRIKIFVARPGVVIGQDAAGIEQLRKDLVKLVGSDNLKVDVVEVKNPSLDAKIVSLQIAKQLEERASFRIVQKKALTQVRKAGAKGVKTSVGGRLGGADIARAEGYKDGTMAINTLRSDIDYACSEAMTTYGKLGVKVWICRGEVETEAPEEKKGE
ncbi:MAG: 30S ribosomal protein S3 [Bacilli bacterium]|nr:30S ribosomal protein S3 [Bacilli bacterium]